jgi:putative FmdB family regulatory protein
VPIYEYRCFACGKPASIFFRSIASANDAPACPSCGQHALERRMSRFWSPRSNDADDRGMIQPDFEVDDVPVYGGGYSYTDESFDSASFGDVSDDNEEGVAGFAREARQMAAMMGETLDQEFDSALRHIEQGADPDDVLGEMDASAPEPSGGVGPVDEV